MSTALKYHLLSYCIWKEFICPMFRDVRCIEVSVSGGSIVCRKSLHALKRLTVYMEFKAKIYLFRSFSFKFQLLLSGMWGRAKKNSIKKPKLLKSYKSLRNKVTNTIRSSIRLHYQSLINENKDNPKNIWRTINRC